MIGLSGHAGGASYAVDGDGRLAITVQLRDSYAIDWTGVLPAGGHVPVQIASMACGVTAVTVRNWIRAGMLAGENGTQPMRVSVDELARLIIARGWAVPPRRAQL